MFNTVILIKSLRIKHFKKASVTAQMIDYLKIRKRVDQFVKSLLELTKDTRGLFAVDRRALGEIRIAHVFVKSFRSSGGRLVREHLLFVQKVEQVGVVLHETLALEQTHLTREVHADLDEKLARIEREQAHEQIALRRQMHQIHGETEDLLQHCAVSSRVATGRRGCERLAVVDAVGARLERVGQVDETIQVKFFDEVDVLELGLLEVFEDLLNVHESAVDLVRAMSLVLLMHGKYFAKERENGTVAYGAYEELVHALLVICKKKWKS